LAAFIVGAALAVGGAVFQAVFRNALATPFTLGISSGASFGAALAVQFMGAFTSPSIPILQLAAFAGAGVSVGLVYGVSRMRRGFSTSDLLLAGVAVSFLFSSLIMLFQYIGDPGQSLRLLHWMMGGIFVTGLDSLVPLLPPILLGGVIIASHTRELDLLLLGEDLAQSRGLDTRRLRQFLFLAVSLMVGASVAVCGPIGFVGLMVPHVCRLVFGAHHALLVPTSALAGGTLLVLCDTLARTVIAPAELPIGVITALLGAPFFLWLLYAGRAEL
jgi:iron complex transport system permease protein